jgi:NADH-quinone oxidoreductase subunit N
MFTVFMLSLAGVPLTSGFIAKFVIFKAGIDSGLGLLVVIALVTSAVAAFYYLRVVVLMYFSDPAEDGPTVAVPSAFTGAVLAVSVAVTIFLGILPQSILDVADKAAHFVS